MAALHQDPRHHGSDIVDRLLALTASTVRRLM
jgi:hypothetical protein